ncbi:MAG: GGDEF domain-containing protein [gamma proteobacterium symbiont of Phacoides pectinatus]
MLLLPNTDAAHAMALAERLRVSIENAPLQEHQHNINMSFGGIEYQPHTTVEDMIQMADQLMYEAKRAGRNRVVFHNPMKQPNPVPT